MKQHWTNANRLREQGKTQLVMDISNSGVPISMNEFLGKCSVEPVVEEIMEDWPETYQFYKGTGKYRDVYWYVFDNFNKAFYK